MKVLFVCNKAVARSPMAETVFLELVGREGGYVTRTAGTASDAARRLTTRDLAWADVVAVMEPEHLAEIQHHWPDHSWKVRVLGVPDDYDPDEPELRRVLAAKVKALLDRVEQTRAQPSSRREIRK
jgi:predicted protein tyrosine phosphatase